MRIKLLINKVRQTMHPRRIEIWSIHPILILQKKKEEKKKKSFSAIFLTFTHMNYIMSYKKQVHRTTRSRCRIWVVLGLFPKIEPFPLCIFLWYGQKISSVILPYSESFILSWKFAEKCSLFPLLL